MNFYHTVCEFQENYPINKPDSIAKALSFGSVTLKKIVTIIIYGKNCSSRSRDPFPQEFENPFFYTATLNNSQCLDIISTGKVKFDAYFNDFFDATNRVDYDIRNYDNK